MNVTFLNNVKEYKNEQSEVDILFEEINHYISDNNYILTMMIIDGMEVFDDFYEFILEHIKDIKTISIQVSTYKEVLDNLFLTTEEYLERAIPEIKQLSSQFYQESSTDLWVKFEQFLEGLQWINQVISSIEQLSVQSTDLQQKYLITFDSIEMTRNLDMAIQNSDLILVGDILLYEAIPLFESLSSDVKNIIDNEVPRNDLN